MHLYIFMMGGMKGACALHKTAGILVFIGALNWGLVGLGGFLGGNWNVVNQLLGAWPQVEWIVYILVGLSALAMLTMHKCKACKMGGMKDGK